MPDSAFENIPTHTPSFEGKNVGDPAKREIKVVSTPEDAAIYNPSLEGKSVGEKP